jgi:hypothetical protein
MMTPEERIALVEKISAKMTDMADNELKDLAKEIGVEEIVEDTDKAISKALADTVMLEPAPVVDTGVLTGSRDGLKSFLIKKSRDKEMQS